MGLIEGRIKIVNAATQDDAAAGCYLGLLFAEHALVAPAYEAAAFVAACPVR